MEPEGSLPHSH